MSKSADEKTVGVVISNETNKNFNSLGLFPGRTPADGGYHAVALALKEHSPGQEGLDAQAVKQKLADQIQSRSEYYYRKRAKYTLQGKELKYMESMASEKREAQKLMECLTPGSTNITSVKEELQNYINASNKEIRGVPQSIDPKFWTTYTDVVKDHAIPLDKTLLPYIAEGWDGIDEIKVHDVNDRVFSHDSGSANTIHLLHGQTDVEEGGSHYVPLLKDKMTPTHEELGEMSKPADVDKAVFNEYTSRQAELLAEQQNRVATRFNEESAPIADAVINSGELAGSDVTADAAAPAEKIDEQAPWFVRAVKQAKSQLNVKAKKEFPEWASTYTHNNHNAQCTLSIDQVDRRIAYIAPEQSCDDNDKKANWMLALCSAINGHTETLDLTAVNADDCEILADINVFDMGADKAKLLSDDGIKVKYKDAEGELVEGKWSDFVAMVQSKKDLAAVSLNSP